MNGAVMKNFVTPDDPFASAGRRQRRCLRQRGRRERRLDRPVPSARSRWSTTSRSTTSRWRSCARCSAISSPRRRSRCSISTTRRPRHLADTLPAERVASLQPRPIGGAQLFAHDLKPSAGRHRFRGASSAPPARSATVRLQVPGAHNVSNALAALVRCACLRYRTAGGGARRSAASAASSGGSSASARRAASPSSTISPTTPTRSPPRSTTLHALSRPAAGDVPAARLRPAAS